MVEVDQHLLVRLPDRFNVDLTDQAVDVGVDRVLWIADVAHLIEVDAPDVLAEEDVLQLPLTSLVEDDAVAVEHPDIGRPAIERRHLHMYGSGNVVFPRIKLYRGRRHFSTAAVCGAGGQHADTHHPT